MRKIVKKVVLYRCSVCSTDYTNKRDAEKCELRTLEKKTLSIGDRVTNIEPRSCSMGHYKPYVFKGRIVKIVGPMASDYEYEVKWLGGKRINSHVFHFQVKFKCPHCKETREERYFAPELKKLSR
jgi:hypothetical protein